MKNVAVLQSFLNQYFGSSLVVDGVMGNKTQTALDEATPKLLKQVAKFAFVPNYTGFLAIRTKQEFDNTATDFLLYFQNGKIAEIMPCSTRAGDFWVFNPITYGGVTGTAVLAEGFYPNTWQATWQNRFGFKSVELLQIKPVRIWRDGNRNRNIDKSVSQTGMFGINIHTAGWNNIIDRWSAGCIVVPKSFWDEFAQTLKIGSLYSLVLLELQEK
ncbi:hypothetical protein [Raineya sp.]